jgi:hypothetical protein
VYFSTLSVSSVTVTHDRDLGPRDNAGYSFEQDCPKDTSEITGHLSDNQQKQKEEGVHVNHDVLDRGETGLSGIFAKQWRYFRDTAQAAFNTVYNISKEALGDIENLLKKILNQEAFNMLTIAFNNAISKLYDPSKNNTF